MKFLKSYYYENTQWLYIALYRKLQFQFLLKNYEIIIINFLMF